MKVLNQESTKRANDWYRHVPAVTREELGITKLTIQDVTDAQVNAGLAGRMTVQTVGGLLFVAIWNSKEGDGTFYMTADNSEEIDGKYYNSFIPSDAFRAHMLQFADAHTSVPEQRPTLEEIQADFNLASDDLPF